MLPNSYSASYLCNDLSDSSAINLVRNKIHVFMMVLHIDLKMKQLPVKVLQNDIREGSENGSQELKESRYIHPGSAGSLANFAVRSDWIR